MDPGNKHPKELLAMQIPYMVYVLSVASSKYFILLEAQKPVKRLF